MINEDEFSGRDPSFASLVFISVRKRSCTSFFDFRYLSIPRPTALGWNSFV